MDWIENRTVQATGISRILVYKICAKNVQGPLVSEKRKGRENQLQ
jgi:hypothetical protein